ncbi:RICIN domain-containing protein [Streptomyces sp. NPDC093225]|uniref:RICIN domain-containing protein n=1 Tax=Streptomyces sp. NPDC093225 TaxID=3366034 RepID=UPI0038140446
MANLRGRVAKALSAVSGLILAVGVASPAQAETTIEGPFRIINLGTQKCLEVADWSLLDGAAVRQWTCTGGKNQQWYVADIYGVNQWTLANANSGKCVDIPGGNVANGVQLIQWDCHYNDNQRFLRRHGTGAEYQFFWNKYNIEIGGYSRANGAPAQLWQDNGGDNQTWYVGD